jgi:polyribonucleotide nucleotidyltransferase
MLCTSFPPLVPVLFPDIAGTEDALGDMDFKVAGTCEGVTAMQLDTKQPGLPVGVLVSALAAAREARLQLLDLMDSALAQQGRQEGAISAPQQQQQEGQVVGSSAPGPVHEVLQMDKDNVVGGVAS